MFFSFHYTKESLCQNLLQKQENQQKLHKKHKKKNQIFLTFLIKDLSFLNESE